MITDDRKASADLFRVVVAVGIVGSILFWGFLAWRHESNRGQLPVNQPQQPLDSEDCAERELAGHDMDALTTWLLSDYVCMEIDINGEAALLEHRIDVLPQVLALYTVDRPVATRVRISSLLPKLGRDVVPLLMEHLKRPDADHRSALGILGSFRPASPEAKAFVLERLSDPSYRLNALQALGAMGDDARDAIPQIEPYLSAPDLRTRRAAAWTLWSIDSRWIDELLRPDSGQPVGETENRDES